LKIDSASFGEIEFDPQTVIEFPQGMIAFEGHKQFKLLHAEDFDGLKWLQSITDEHLAFSLMEPIHLGYELEITLSDEEAELLGSSNADELLVFLPVYENNEGEHSSTNSGNPSSRSMRASWRTPIILNPVKCIGYQKALSGIKRTVLVRGS